LFVSRAPPGKLGGDRPEMKETSMRKHPLLIIVAATALLVGVSIASAQRQDQQGASEPKGAPTQKSPDVAPGPKAPATKPDTSGQAPAEPKAKDVQ